MPPQKFSFPWPEGRLGAVSLTYDDALPCHFEQVAPQLEEAGLRGTFNLITGRAAFLDHAAHWRRLAGSGHELGNHTLFHPCRSEPPDLRPLHDTGYNLAAYSERRLRDELAVANWMLAQLDGRSQRTYANTCHHTAFGFGEMQQAIEPVLADYFVAGRGALTGRPVDLVRADPMHLGTAQADLRTFADLRAEIEGVVEAGGWVVYTVHGVGEGSHKWHMAAEEHRQLIAWLGRQRERIWTAPMLDVALYWRQR
ncbi:MAG: polysaccharide deacetylase family protein [Chloroflexota bacterium]